MTSESRNTQYATRNNSDDSSSPRADLEAASCPLCGSAPAPTLRYDFAPYRVVDCPNCGLAFLSPRMTESAILKL